MADETDLAWDGLDSDEQAKGKARREMAAVRTDWAKERTLLAQERTFSAWGRTGTAAMGIGLAIARLLGGADVSRPWLARAVGVVMILTGATIFVVGFMSYRKVLKKMGEESVGGLSLKVVGLVTFGLMFSAVLALLLIFEY